MWINRFSQLCVLLSWFTMTDDVFAGDCKPLPQRLLTARFPIIFHPPPKLQGRSIQRIEAWRFDNQVWSQVPLQIDEVNQEGNYVLDEGLPFTKFMGDDHLKDRDEMSVNGDSLGGAFSELKIPKSMAARFSQSIQPMRVDFCGTNTGYLGSLLIAQTINTAKPTPFVPIFSREKESVSTSNYRYNFRKGHPMLMGEVLLRTPTGEKPVFAGSSFVMPLIPKLFFLPSFYFGESDFTSEIESWRSGPVRSIVAVGAKMRKFFSLIDLHLFSELVFYDRYFQIPTKIEFIFDPSNYMARGTGLAYVLKYPENLDWTLTSNLEALPQSGPESGPLKHTAFDSSKNGTFAIKGGSPIGSFAVNIKVDQSALKMAPPPYLASRESFSQKDMISAWPWLKKSAGSLGVFIEISSVHRGTYDFGLDVALSNQAHDTFTDFQTVSATWPDPAAN
jgi:hypothetical protein